MKDITYSDFAAIFQFPPTDEQKAVIINEDPAMLITAGAGAGKTATMSQRIAWQVIKGNVAAHQVLGLTFTNKAAAELAERTNKQLRLCQAKLIDEPKELSFLQAQHDLSRPTVKTYNSFASEIASSYAILIGENPNARLITEAERREIIAKLLENIEVLEGETFLIGASSSSDAEDISPQYEANAELLENTPGASDLDLAVPKIILTKEEFEILSASGQNSLGQKVASLASKIIDNNLDLDRYREYLERELSCFGQVSEGVRATSKYYDNLDFSDSLVTPDDVKKTVTEFKKLLNSMRLNLVLLKIVAAYLDYKKNHGVIEFADQVSWACRILEEVPEVAEKIRAQYKMVLLDEYQDTSVTQARMLRIAFRGIPYICAVGDPMQAIYGWRGASANALSDFITDFQVKDTAQLTLSIAFRNSKNILQLANTLTKPLRIKPQKLKLPTLQAAPKSQSGEVKYLYRNLKSDSDEALGKILKEITELKGESGELSSVAILVRTNRRALELAESLSQAKVRHEIVGGGLLIQTPEIKAIRSLLTVCVDDQSPIAALYVFNFFGISAHDLRAFSELRRLDYAPDILSREVLGIDGWDFPETNLTQLLQYFSEDIQRFKKALKIVEDKEEAKENAGNKQQDSRKKIAKLSEEARWRIEYLLLGIARLRKMQQSSLREVITEAAKILQLQVTAESRASGGATIRSAIEGFKRMGDAFSDRDGGSLAAFIKWLELAEQHDRDGVEQAEDAPAVINLEEEIVEKPGIVQILTMHAAKGLEWDYVVIPDLVSGKIDSDSVKSAKPWMRDAEAIPDQLRVDAMHIPQFSFADVVDSMPPELKPGEQKVFLGYELSRYQKKFIQHIQSEQRRLLYVAATRPKKQLILTSYAFNEPEDIYHVLDLKEGIIELAEEIQLAQDSIAQGEEPEWSNLKKKFKFIPPSGYLNEIKNATEFPLLADTGNEPSPLNPSFFSWYQDKFAWIFTELDTREITSLDELQKILKHEAATNLTELSWPAGNLRGIEIVPGKRSNELFDENISDSESISVGGVELIFNSAEYVLNQALIEHNNVGNFEPEYLTASNVVSLFKDSEEFLKEQIRPMPRKPIEAAYTGTEVHAKIASHFSGVLKLDLDELEAWNKTDLDLDDDANKDLMQAQINELINRFETSEFAELEPIAIEKPMEFLLAGKPIRCVIDAVFDTSKIPGRRKVTIVDWKTGRKPTSELLESRKLQLALYTHAWAKTTGTSLDDIEAIFYYLGEKDPDQRELQTELIAAADLEKLLQQKLEFLQTDE
ncbi:MAG: ATP-dependent DNA helicase [Arcanobacterium sp.]|nr:ATP-dependent DNA helicase [Arcanobacterium sp.]